MNWLSRLARGRARTRTRPWLEALEDRTLLATRMIVPLSQPADMVNTFHDLTTAVNAASTVAGDNIQVEPGSTPGGATVNKALVLQGDPKNGPPSLPAAGPLVLASTGITLRNLNLGTVTINNGVTGATIQNNLLISINQIFGRLVNGSDTITGNTIAGPVVLGNNSVNPAALADQVLDNNFRSGATGTLLRIDHENGPQVRGNTFADLVPGVTAAIQVEDSLGAGISNDTISLTGPASTGILIQNPASATSAIVTDNRIDTNLQGTGIATVKTATSSLIVSAANNDLVRNLVGLRVTGDGTANADAFGTIDAGGGALGSQGGNDFHLYTGAGGHFAIVAANAVATPAFVTARGDIFSTGTPATVVQAGAGTVDVGAPLSPQAAFADRLFDVFTHRSATPGSELNFWADMAARHGTRQTARRFLRTNEPLRNLVDLVFLKVLGRRADPASAEHWTGRLLKGVPLEKVMASLLASPDFLQRARTLVPAATDDNSTYIEGLYIVLLGFVPSSGEVSTWTARLPRVGKMKMALNFLSFPFFRQRFASALYITDLTLSPTAFVTGLPNLLHRATPPSSSELAPLIVPHNDLLTILAEVAGSNEFFTNG
jgi:hypothetical protein